MKGVRVLLDEEYGYRHWVWNTGMTEEDLVKWFSENIGKNDSVFCNPRSLPGEKKLISIGQYNDMSRGSWRAMFHDADDSYMISPRGTKYGLGD